MEADEDMVVICGNNKKLETLLKRELVHRKNVKSPRVYGSGGGLHGSL